ncbi:sodium-coupled monocarboxylate transporter 1 [Elysia marginata]|uniref:Sodium-coupled monocarboxylate transporter 1 n=1 Tax=Elysia marginata TaxID=1093978 RepID=A0AAV4GGY3_9GAST|nr:sodium-coupled monocarboxylate transporter 1 [Elysia marginata]
MSSDPKLTVPDYVVATVILTIPVGVGIWYAIRDAKKATREEYLLGGRRMALLPVALSIFITFQSAVSQIGIPADVFFYGFIYVVSALGIALSFLLGYVTVVPLMYPLHITSLYEYLKLRYKSEAVRMVSTVVGMLATICYMAIALLSPGLALQASAGLPLWVTIAVFGAVCTVYTAIGGIKSVIWTDAFQTVVVFVGTLVIIIKACITVGGLGEAWHLAQAGGITDFRRFNPDPTIRHNLWALVIGHCFIWLVNGFNQSTLQRISSMKNLKDAKRAFLVMVPCILTYTTMFSLTGLVIFAYFSLQECDPYKGKLISNRNQLAPYFVLHAMQDLPGMTGLYISILCCGGLSTLSSGINALAANTVEDVMRQPLRSLSEGTITLLTKLFVLFYGGIIIGLAYLAKSLKGPITQMASSVFGACGSPILGIFLMGGAVPWANKYGALSGLLASLTFNLWITVGNRVHGVPIEPLPSIGTEGCSKWAGLDNSTDAVDIFLSNFTSSVLFNTVTANSSGIQQGAMGGTSPSEIFPMYKISYDWYSMFGTIVCVVVGLLVSYLTNRCCADVKGRPAIAFSTESRLIFPFLRRFWGIEEPGFAAYNVNIKTSKDDLPMGNF